MAGPAATPELAGANRASHSLHRKVRVSFHLSGPEHNGKERDEKQQEIHKTGCPVPTKGICTPSERLVTQPQILSSPEVSLKRHDSCAAFGQYLQRLWVLGAESGAEPVLQNQTNGDAGEQDNDQDYK